jgi:hypothetical protein
MPMPRTKTVGAKVTEEEYEQLEAHAVERGVSLSEWCREALLGVEDRDRGGNDETLLAEVLGLRTILLNVLYGMANGERLTEEQMRKLIERADASKGENARAKLAEKPQREKISGNGNR